jgi:hypothetical protein
MKVVVRTNLLSRQLVHRRAIDARYLIAALLLVAVAGAYAVWSEVHRDVEAVRREYASSKAKEASLAGSLQIARLIAEERAVVEARRGPLLKMAERRWSWAPVLHQIVSATPANTEISSLYINVVSIDQGTLRLSGRSAGANPRLESDNCRLRLAKVLTEAGYEATARFTKLEESGDTAHPVADFIIELKVKNLPHDSRKT